MGAVVIARGLTAFENCVWKNEGLPVLLSGTAPAFLQAASAAARRRYGAFRRRGVIACRTPAPAQNVPANPRRAPAPAQTAPAAA